MQMLAGCSTVFFYPVHQHHEKFETRRHDDLELFTTTTITDTTTNNNNDDISIFQWTPTEN